MNNNDILKRIRASRMVLAMAAFFCMLTGAQAVNRVTISGFSIKPGEEKTVAVNLDNSDLMSTLQMDITLPAGIDYKEGSLARNESRLDRDTHSILMQGIGYKKYRILILPSDVYDINGSTGAVVYFTVVAADDFTGTGNIKVDRILGSSSHADGEGNTPQYWMDDVTVVVNAYSGRLYTAEDTLAVKTDGTAKRVSVVLDNYVGVRGMQADITLPEGLSFETRDNGRPKFEYGDRVPQNMTISSNTLADGSLRVAVSGLTEEMFEGNTGEVFAFSVTGGDGLALKSEITFSNVIVSDNDGAGLLIDDVRPLEVTNSFLAHYTPANDSVQALRDMYAGTVDSILADKPEMESDETFASMRAAVEEMIDGLQGAVDAAYADETLASGYVEVMSPAADIIEAIDGLRDYATSTTGITEVTGNVGNAPVGYYTLSGTRVAGPVKGQVCIVKYADGTVKKLYVE